MKVLLVGATGATGRVVLRKLLKAGHEVTAVARNPADIEASAPNLRIVRGDARDAESLRMALHGQGAVISTLGPRSLKADDLQEVFMRNLVAAMQSQGVKRLVNLSAAGAGSSLKEVPFFLRSILIPFVLKKTFHDKDRGEAILFASGLSFVNVRPPLLSNGPARGNIKAQTHAEGLVLKKVTREDVADFMIGQLASDEWIGRSPLLGH